ncbi:MAG: NADPH-dependent glutamate synthase [Actinobacteria bacterium]|nr:NADPH-dependent glutamate synthase [Actinomycetota bacterium]
MVKKEIIPDVVHVKRQKPEERKHNFNEVALGYNSEEAFKEASRCLGCKKAPCVKGCPVGIDIPGFIAKIVEGDPIAGAAKIKESNFLPGICGRVCPQENQCEKECVMGKKYDPISIGKLERFVADVEAGEGVSGAENITSGDRPAAAVIGSGPAGLTTAGELARNGYPVTVFEALHVAGGVLTYGIPEFRLPQWVVDREVDFLKSAGVEFVLDFVVGKTATLDELLKEYKSAFIGIGAGTPMFMGVPGENLNGVYSANEFLTRANLMSGRTFPEYDTPVKRGGKVIVVGGGNVAMDSARTALRMGASEVDIVYRRSRVEMPARIEEIENGEEEGINFFILTNPVEILGENGECTAAVCQKMELGEPDDSGRRRPVPIEGEFVTLKANTVIMAIGTNANPLLPSTTPDLKLNRWGYIDVDPETGLTSIPGVYAGGDIVTGSATVIEAMGAGKAAATAMINHMERHGS